MKKEEMPKTEEEWKQKLTPEQFRILRKKGTEQPFTGKYNDSKEKGIFVCAACGGQLFSSDTKYDSGSGWPSFYEPVSNDKIEEKIDESMNMSRTEVLCSKCKGHLGHKFNDGPKPTGLRYCINSASLDLKSKDKVKTK